MVTFPAVGRMGNFLFECGCALAYSLKHDLEFTVPTTTTDHVWSKLYLQHLANLNWDNRKEKIDLWENGHQYQELPFDEAWRDKNIIIQGYRQSHRYVDEFRSEIIYSFDFPYELQKDTCSLHARFGDYLFLTEKHIIVDEQYLNEAMRLVIEKTGIEKFKVFSDNIGLFKERFGGLHNFEYSNNSNEVDDLIEMSCCHSNIGSSSTFSWWGSWLNRNPDKVIITPKKWFQDGWGGLDTKDLIPESWIKL